MPVVGTSAYNTAGQITSLVRSLLNDAAGNLFTDGALLPYANSAYRKVQRSLANIQSGTFLTDDLLLVVSALPATDPSAHVAITDATAPPNQSPWHRAGCPKSLARNRSRKRLHARQRIGRLQNDRPRAPGSLRLIRLRQLRYLSAHYLYAARLRPPAQTSHRKRPALI